MKVQRWSRGINLLFRNHDVRRRLLRSCRLIPGKETQCQLHMRLGGPQRRSGQMRKISPPTGIRSPPLETSASVNLEKKPNSVWSTEDVDNFVNQVVRLLCII